MGCTKPTASHYSCTKCLEGFVQSRADAESMRVFISSSGVICCPGINCGSPPFVSADIAKLVSARTFELLSNARAALTEQRINATLEADFEKRLQRKEAEWLQLSEAERRRRANRNHVVERILTLACPRCGQAFVDFGC